MCDETSFIPERNTSTASYYDTIGKLRFLSFNGTNLRRILNNVTESSTFLLEEYNTQMNKTANVLLPTIAQRKTELELAVRELDVAFLLVGAVSTFMVKAGYLLRNTGLVQLPYMQSTLIMSLWDTSLVVLSWWIVGNGWTFGSDKYPHKTENGLVGKSHYFDYMSERTGIDDAADWASYVYFLGLCSQCVAIVSGAVMERTTMRGYLVAVVFIASLLFPSVAHSLWNVAGWATADRIENIVFDCGVVDHGGSAAVHMVGGICALSAVLVIEPRKWRYRPATSTMVPAVHSSMIMTVFGSYFVVIFSVGAAFFSVQHSSSEMQAALLAGTNTGVSAAMGGLVAVILGWMKDRVATKDGPGERIYSLELLAGGGLAGLASVAAGAPYFSHIIAAVVGAVGAFLYIISGLLMNFFCVDDCSSSVAIHAFGGAWGMLAVGLFMNPENYYNHYKEVFDDHGAKQVSLYGTSAHINAQERVGRCAGIFYLSATNKGAQFQAQLLFVIGTFISIGLASLLLFYLIKRTVKIRVSKQKEEDGIDRHDFGGQSSAPIELRMVTTDQTWIYAPLVENIKAAQETDFLCQRLKARVQARTLARVSGDSDSSLPWSKEGFQVYEKELKKYLVKDGLLWRRTKEPTRTKPIDEEAFQCRPHWVMYIPRHAASLKFHACYYELQKNSAEKVDDDVSTADTISVAMLELRKKYWWGNPLLTDDHEGKGSESNIWAEMEG